MVLRGDSDRRFERDHAFLAVTRDLQASPVAIAAIVALVASAVWAAITGWVRGRSR